MKLFFTFVLLLAVQATVKCTSSSLLSKLIDALEEIDVKRENNDKESLKCDKEFCHKGDVCVATMSLDKPHCIHIHNTHGGSPDTKCAGRCSGRSKCVPFPEYENAHRCVPDPKYCENCKSNEVCIDYGWGPICVQKLKDAKDDDKCGGLCSGRPQNIKCEAAGNDGKLMNCKITRK